MSSRWRRLFGPKLAGILLLALSGSRALADDGCGCQSECAPSGRGCYAGLFGGGGVSSINDVTQLGTALFDVSAGGPLGVNASGNSDSEWVGLVGLQIGYEWSAEDSNLLPAVEFEGFYLGGTQRATVSDPNNRLNGHVFDNTFPMDAGVFLTNVVLSYQTSDRGLTPYVGCGIGAAGISISGADSLQVVPPEPGVNHFNSDPDASDWAFAAQAKVGVRFALSERAYVFAEYRFLYVGASTYVFGSTVFPGHAPTTPWTVQFGDTCSHLGVGGIGFKF